jgi:hypothetical protein
MIFRSEEKGSEGRSYGGARASDFKSPAGVASEHRDESARNCGRRERIGIYRKVRLRRFINPDKRLLQAPEVAAQRAWRERRKRARETETLAGTDIAT